MMKAALTLAWATILLGGSGLVGCSDDDDDSSTNTGGTAGSGGTSSSGGSSDSAGAPECVGAPPITPNKTCADIPSEKAGDAGFTVTSPDFDDCGEIPKSMTCDGNDFGTGDSPRISWSGAPAGTKSFAVVFKDISLSNDVATERFGYHWVMWDIPASTSELPGKMGGGYESPDVAGAHQWSSLGSYGFFTPCPNPFPRDAPMFMCQLTEDSYSVTVYALDQETLDDLPEAIDTGTNMPAAAGWNWVVNMAHYIEGLDALAVAEYRGTSHAWAKAFVPPNAEKFPCTKDAVSDACLH